MSQGAWGYRNSADKQKGNGSVFMIDCWTNPYGIITSRMACEIILAWRQRNSRSVAKSFYGRVEFISVQISEDGSKKLGIWECHSQEFLAFGGKFWLFFFG